MRHPALSCFKPQGMGMPLVPPALAGNAGPHGERGVSDDLLAENLRVAGFNPLVRHRHSALSCSVARAMPSVPPAVAGISGAKGVLVVVVGFLG